MKATLSPVATMKLTVSQGNTTVSKNVSDAETAAEFYAEERACVWWQKVVLVKGAVIPSSGMITAYRDRLYYRVLPIFKKYLP